MKTCPCGKPKLPDRSICRECRNAKLNERYRKDRVWRENLRQQVNANYDPQKKRLWYMDMKQKAYDVLGGFVCVHCGFLDPRALQIDHIDGDGYTGRKARGEIGISLYRQVVATQGKGFQVLCANCNWIKKAEEGHYGGVKRTRLDKYPIIP